MNTYQKIDLIIALFTAIGTCGATALALYFWLHENSLKLKCHVMHANKYGMVDNIDCGFLVVKFTNAGYKPIMLQSAGFKFTHGFFSKSYTYLDLRMQNNNQIQDNIPKILQHGESYNFVTSWNDFIAECKKIKFRYVNLYAGISSINKEIKCKLEKYLFKKIMQEMKESNHI